MEIDGYIRVSRVNGRGGESFISPAVQQEKIEAYAQARGHRIVAWHTDLDQSGAKADRPNFQLALGRVEARQTGGIAVAKLDRFARSVADAAQAIRRINAAGGELISVEDGFDSSTPMGKFAMTMVLAIAELELDRIRESWSAAQRHAVERGVHVASQAPTGYRRRDDGRLELDRRAARAVAELFEAKAAGTSLSELARLLERHRVTGPYGNEHWTTSAVAKLLRNRVYLGEARSGRYANPGAHPAIVDEQQWKAAQNGRPVSPVSPLRSPDGALLAGLLRCSGCRYVMKPDTTRDRDGTTIRNYRCRGDHAAGRCPQRSSVLGRLIEPYVEQQFLDALVPGGTLAHSEPTRRDLQDARQQVDAAERELEAWVNEPALTQLGRELYLAGLQTRQTAVDETRAALAELRGPGDQAALPDDVELRKLWPTLTVAERRRLLARGIDAVMLRPGHRLDERTLILWRGQAPADLPARGRRVPLAPFAWPD
jgi:DNA invertase Pin-like site-specific DNA recombinase